MPNPISFLFDALNGPVTFGINFKQLAGFGQGLPTLGGGNYLQEALRSAGSYIDGQLSSLPRAFRGLASLPLSLLVIDSYMAEHHSASAQITNDPVEMGPNITSHAYANPVRVTIDFVVNDYFFAEFSAFNTPLQDLSFLGAINRVALSYLVLDGLRRSATPVYLNTRTYTYDSMLIEDINVSRNLHYNTRGIFSVTLKEIFEASSGCFRRIHDRVNTIDPKVQSIKNMGGAGNSGGNMNIDATGSNEPSSGAQKR